MDSVITLDPFIVAVIGGTLVPILTALVTKLQAASGVKAIVALLLSVIVGVAGTVTTSDTFEWKVAFLAAGSAFAMNVVTYLGVHTAIGSGNVIGAQATADFGLGKALPPG